MKRIGTTLTGAILIAVTALALGGCVFAPSGDNGYKHDRENVKPTVGQQLLDLDHAREKGVISAAEFEKAKRDVLDSIK